MRLSFKQLPAILWLIPILFLFFQACGPRKTDEPACGFVQNVYGERISWKSALPVGLYVHESYPIEFLPALQKAIQNWEEILGRQAFKIVQTGYQSASPRQDGVNVIYWLKTWETQKTMEQARTSVYWVGDQMREADIKINDKDFNFYLDKPKSSTDVHLESLFLHELGHVLGLKHTDESNSIMGTYLASSSVRTQVSPVDKENVKCEYQ